MRKRDVMILWPQYFDKDRPVRLGRRVPLNIATSKPITQDLFEATRKLGYKAEVEPLAKYPASWFDEIGPGRVVIDSMGQKKTYVIKRVASEVQVARSKRITQTKSDDEDKKKNKKKNRKRNIEVLKKKIVEKTSK